MKTESCQKISFHCVKALLKRHATLIKMLGSVIVVASIVAIAHQYWH